jgi:hypothetical protein
MRLTGATGLEQAMRAARTTAYVSFLFTVPPAGPFRFGWLNSSNMTVNESETCARTGVRKGRENLISTSQKKRCKMLA